MEHFKFKAHNKVLFLGEGNFSFSYCLLKHLSKKFEISDFPNLYVTCFQSELSPSALAHVNYLNSMGVKVLLDVDATKLEVTQSISSHKFDKIIFNFPHVGGKMKIHLNRELLCNFFPSASRVLAPAGVVIVTLCSGQGGTAFDPHPRRWDDSWQIVEQAANGDFILADIDLFQNDLFADYKPVGYRGREQMFYTKSAVVHCFKKSEPLITEINKSILDDVQSFHKVDSHLLVSYVHKYTIASNPFSRDYSPQSCLAKMFGKALEQQSDHTFSLRDELPFHVEYNSRKAPCNLDGKNYSLRSNLLEVLSPLDKKLFVCGLVFKKCSSDFSDFCTRCQCIVKGSVDTVKNVLSNIISQFNFLGSVYEEISMEGVWELYLENKLEKSKIAWENMNSSFISFDLDSLCALIFQVSVRQLWCSKLKLDLSKNIAIPVSLYPLLFKFDISLACKGELNFDKFYYILHQLPDRVVESVLLISTYYLTDTLENTYCFRLNYRSYSKPLNRKLAIQFHENVTVKLLVNQLDVRIR